MARKKPDLNDLRLCVDRPVPVTATMDAAVLAMAENRENEPPPLSLRRGAVIHPFEMALFATKQWANGRKVGVRFLNGSKKQKMQTQKYGEMWEQFANVNFDFGAKAAAEIRVSFQERGSWSALGTDCLVTNAFPKTQPTMNYGWLRDDTEEDEWRRVVLHEFGHALGAIHEHQNPKGGIQWNVQEVYRVFSGPPNNWTKAQIDFNILQKYSVDQLNATAYDEQSIMLYSFPADLIQDHHPTPNNTDLSTADRQFIARMYPKKKPATPSMAAAAPAMAIADKARAPLSTEAFRQAAENFRKNASARSR